MSTKRKTYSTEFLGIL